MRAMYVDNGVALQQVAATERSLSRMKQLAPLSVALIPDRYRFDAKLESTARKGLSADITSTEAVIMERESELMSAVSERLNIELIDPNDTFRAEGAGELLAYPINGHLTQRGQKLVAEVVLRRSAFLQNLCKAP